MLSKPHYIEEADVESPFIRYSWNDWNLQQIYRPPDPELWARLQGLTHRAMVGLTIASGEWVAYRFASIVDRHEPLQLVEAAWAANVHRAYSYAFHTDGAEWRGPVLGPLNLMMAIVVDSLYGRNLRTDPAESPCWMDRLAEHVLPDVEAYRAWQAVCVARLHQFCDLPDPAHRSLFDDAALAGDWVPRELFDPSFPYSPELAPDLIRQFLMTLEHDEDNPFLATPEEMLDQGYPGTPYHLPIPGDEST